MNLDATVTKDKKKVVASTAPPTQEMENQSDGRKLTVQLAEPKEKETAARPNMVVSEISKRTGSVELTEKDIRIGRAFWRQNIDPQQSAFSAVMFRELFVTYPETEYFFLNMRDSSSHDATDIFTSPQFHNHMMERVVPKLKEIIENLDNPKELQNIMTKIGLYHAKMYVRKRNIDELRRIILTSARRITGSKMLREEEVALDRCLAKSFSIAQDTIDEYRRQHPERFGKHH